MPYGLLSTGFAPKPLTVIRDELNADWKDRFGSSVDTSDGSIDGQVLGIMAERFALLWEGLEAVNSSQDPNAATGTGLDALAALTGTTREPAQESTVQLVLTGDPGTVIADGSLVTVEVTGDEFETTESATLVALAVRANFTAYALGDRIVHSVAGVDRCYQCVVAGNSGNAPGPTGETGSVADGTVTWSFLGFGTAASDDAGDGVGPGDDDPQAQSTETGAIVGVARTITEIQTPISGWSSVINLLDATPGQDLESDEELRVRRLLEVTRPGQSTPDAIRAAVLDVEDVETAVVFYNDTDVTDADGVPPHSVEVLVQGGDDQDIVDAIFASVAAGIGTHGTESGTAVDSEGTSHTIEFSRPDEVEIYVIVTLTKNPLTYPADGDDQVKDAIVAYGDAQAIGRNAVASALVGSIFGVTGVLSVDMPLIDDAPAPATSATVVITNRQLAVYDTSRITVNSSDGDV